MSKFELSFSHTEAHYLLQLMIIVFLNT